MIHQAFTPTPAPEEDALPSYILPQVSFSFSFLCVHLQANFYHSFTNPTVYFQISSF